MQQDATKLTESEQNKAIELLDSMGEITLDARGLLPIEHYIKICEVKTRLFC